MISVDCGSLRLPFPIICAAFVGGFLGSLSSEWLLGRASAAPALSSGPLLSASLLASPTAPAAGSGAADGCYHVYLDLGTNTAVQFHKLYDPDVFPEVNSSLITPKFNNYFGADISRRRSDVCGFGFEPNPSHHDILQQTTAHYAAAGVRLTIFESAVGTFDGWGIVVTDSQIANDEWGARIVPVPTGSPAPSAIHVVDFAAWFAANIQHRQRPAQGARAQPPALVVKVDIEGSDESVIGKALASGVLCTMDYVYIEHLRPVDLDFFMRELHAAGCSTVMEIVDDESYHNFKPAWVLPSATPPPKTLR